MRQPQAADRRSAHTALETAFLRGFVYGVSALVWFGVATLVVHHFVR